MKSLLLTNEYPPNVYGGAGIHVQYLARELAKICEVEVRCFGDQFEEGGNPSVYGVSTDLSSYTAPKPLQSVFAALQKCLDFNTKKIDADVVHLHTWYAHSFELRDSHGLDRPFAGAAATVEERATGRRI